MKISNYLFAMTTLLFVPGFCVKAVANSLSATGKTVANTVPLKGFLSPLKEDPASMTKEQKEERISVMKERVKEIKAMDKSKLTKEQRKALRTELKSMNAEARSYGHPGVYISVGALIIIILLLILILH